jgi:transcriptional regulator with XRE-family HTH domain
LAFAELIHTSKTTLRTWLIGETLPRIDVLLRFAFNLGISARELLMSRGLHEVDWAGIKSRFSGESRTAKCYRSSESLLDLMRAALRDDECPSVPELTKRLGYKRPERLRQVSPDLCRRLTKKHRACRRTHWWRVPGARRIAELERIRASLEQSLKQDPPTSVRRIAAQLGYAGGNGGFIHRSFPDLCAAIAKRLAVWKDRRRQELRPAVIAAIAEQPPPTLHEMSRRLGFQTSTTLRSWVPDLADRLVKQRAEYAATKDSQLHASLSRVLEEAPAPSLNSVARGLQRSTAFLREKHPDLCHAITSRYLQSHGVRRKSPTRLRAQGHT